MSSRLATLPIRPGLGAGVALQGECKQGTFSARGRSLGLLRRRGSSTEICDGKDNDCDGQIDKTTPDWWPECRSAWVANVFRFGGGSSIHAVPTAFAKRRLSAGGLCRQSLSGRQLCDAKGNCYDPCSKGHLSARRNLLHGVCQDCYSRGCSTGETATVENASLIPARTCTAVRASTVANGTCCRAARAWPAPDGQSCDWVNVWPMLARTSVVQRVPTAIPATAKCQTTRPVWGFSCLAGTVCVEASGQVEANPCEVVRCQDPETCAVQPDGHAECVLDQQGGQGPSQGR